MRCMEERRGRCWGEPEERPEELSRKEEGKRGLCVCGGGD